MGPYEQLQTQTICFSSLGLWLNNPFAHLLQHLYFVSIHIGDRIVSGLTRFRSLL